MSSIPANIGVCSTKCYENGNFSEIVFKVEIPHIKPYKLKNINLNKMKTDQDF